MKALTEVTSPLFASLTLLETTLKAVPTSDNSAPPMFAANCNSDKKDDVVPICVAVLAKVSPVFAAEKANFVKPAASAATPKVTGFNAFPKAPSLFYCLPLLFPFGVSIFYFFN